MINHCKNTKWKILEINDIKNYARLWVSVMKFHGRAPSCLECGSLLCLEYPCWIGHLLISASTAIAGPWYHRDCVPETFASLNGPKAPMWWCRWFFLSLDHCNCLSLLLIFHYVTCTSLVSMGFETHPLKLICRSRLLWWVHVQVSLHFL